MSPARRHRLPLPPMWWQEDENGKLYLTAEEPNDKVPPLPVHPNCRCASDLVYALESSWAEMKTRPWNKGGGR